MLSARTTWPARSHNFHGDTMLALNLIFWALALLGHAALWVGIVNRIHATGIPRPVIKTIVLSFYLAFWAIPPLIAWQLLGDASHAWAVEHWFKQPNVAEAYVMFCAAFGAMHLPVWAYHRWRKARPLARVQFDRSQMFDLAAGGQPTNSLRTRLFCALPFNQIWDLQVLEYTLTLRDLPEALDGLSIGHISDLHFSKRIERSYYDQVVERTNALGADLIALTGDVCDVEPRICWVNETLSKLQARLGKYFILGNHDLRTHAVAHLRSEMSRAGFVDLGGRQVTLSAAPITLAGNERPWFSPLATDPLPTGVLKLLLSHSPDQLPWARRRGFDLMLAGHTHGGQVRFPLIGPVVCPSWHGTKYACGFFDESPTLLHVSRGSSSYFPFRLNCPPEITKLTLRRASTRV